VSGRKDEGSRLLLGNTENLSVDERAWLASQITDGLVAMGSSQHSVESTTLLLLADRTKSAQLEIDAYLAESVKEERNKQTLGIVVVDEEMAALSTKDELSTKTSELERDEQEIGSVRLHGLGDV
jgi:hypothetical protein